MGLRSSNPAETFARANWRYLYNRVGDLVAVRDPRGCGQDFYYDLAGRLIGEEYVSCGEAQSAGDDASVSDALLPAGAIGLEPTGAPKHVTVAYHFDELPGWATSLGAGDAPLLPYHARGRATGVSDRAQRSAVAYDERGNPVWTARQMAQIQTASTGVLAVIAGNDPFPGPSETQATHLRTYDESATYVVRTRFDSLGRPYQVTLPGDPDWAMHGNLGPAPTIGGLMAYSDLGLPVGVAFDDGTTQTMVSWLFYDQFLQPYQIAHGDDMGLVEELEYDVRHRPTRIRTHRPNHTPPSTPSSSGLAELVNIVDYHYGWDEADNLISVENAGETPATLKNGYRPARQTISHDSLYRVTNVFFEYLKDDASWGTDTSTDWRAERTRPNADLLSHHEADPMREKPAPMLSPLPPERVNDLVYRYDWLANMVEWDDDGTEAFYERKIGAITNGGDDAYLNGYGEAPGMRPSALYMASDISDMPGTWQGGGQNRGGWLEVRYGAGGNVVGMVVRADCRDAGNSNLCHDGGATDLAARKLQLLEDCECQREQYYEYHWDEVNRLSEARRYDRTGGSGGWSLEVRQRYRYDASNQRMVKQTLDSDPATNDPMERVHLYVYPGRYERSGLVTSGDGATFGPYEGDEALGSETQYTVGGARMVWKNETDTGSVFDKDRRITYAVKDVIQSTSAVVDLVSGELLELTTFYPNGARETHRTQDEVSVQAELMGFTGKEADEEVGVVYFGERYLIPRIGRWASPDPLAVHAAGGGEVLNSYHYVAGNLLQGRDPVGLSDENVPEATPVNSAPAGVKYGEEFVWLPPGTQLPDGVERVSGDYYRGPEGLKDSLAARGALHFVYEPDAPLSLDKALEMERNEAGSAGKFSEFLHGFAFVMAAVSGRTIDAADPNTKIENNPSDGRNAVTGGLGLAAMFGGGAGAGFIKKALSYAKKAFSLAKATRAAPKTPNLGNLADDLRLGTVEPVPTGSTAIQRVGDALGTVDDVLANPKLLKDLNPADLQLRLGGTLPSGWSVETLGRGAHRGKGFVLRQYTPRGHPTGRQLRWHPGGGHHGPDPYWRVINGTTKSDIIPAAPWP